MADVITCASCGATHPVGRHGDVALARRVAALAGWTFDASLDGVAGLPLCPGCNLFAGEVQA